MCAWGTFVFLQVCNRFGSDYFKIEPINLVIPEFHLGVVAKYKLLFHHWWQFDVVRLQFLTQFRQQSWWRGGALDLLLLRDMGDGEDDDGDKGNDDDNNNNDDDDNDNDDNDAVFMCFNPADLPFLTSFIGVTIEGGDLRFLEVVAFGGVLFFVVLAMVGCLFWFEFGHFFLIEEKN
jgi:hypothetical protein